jgi:hypothetical protein
VKLELVRVKERHDATLGVLCIDDYPRLVTLEKPWLGNQKDISCIPTGRYQLTRYYSSKFGETFLVERVPKRSHILFHKGNIPADTRGCILVGMEFGVTMGASMITESKDAFEWFLRYLSGTDEAELTIKAAYHTGATAL